MREFPGVEELLESTPAAVFESVVLRSAAAMGGPVAVLMLDHLDLVDFYLTDVHPERPELSGRFPLRVEEGHLREVLHDHEVVHAPAEEWQVQPIDASYLSAAPVRLRNTVIGAMFFGSEQAPTAHQLDDLRRLGVRSGVAISVADQYTDLVETRRRRAAPSIAAELQSDQLPPRVPGVHEHRRRLAQTNQTEQEHIEAAAKAAVAHAEHVFHAKRHAEQRRNDPKRRQLMGAVRPWVSISRAHSKHL